MDRAVPAAVTWRNTDRSFWYVCVVIYLRLERKASPFIAGSVEREFSLYA